MLPGRPAGLRLHSEERLKQFSKLLDGKTSVPGNATHGERVDRVMARNRDDPLAVAHHDVLSLAKDSESCLLQRPYGVEMVDAGNLRQR